MFLFNFGMIGLSFYHSMNKNNHQTFSFNKPKPQTIFLWFSEFYQIEISSTDWLLPGHLLWHMMLMVRPIRALCCHDVHSNCYWITGIGVMDGTHGQYQGAPGVTTLSLINHTEMWPRAISSSAFLHLKF